MTRRVRLGRTFTVFATNPDSLRSTLSGADADHRYCRSGFRKSCCSFARRRGRGARREAASAEKTILRRQFWADQGFAPNEVVYVKGLGDGNLDAVSESICQPRVKIAGLVVDKVDKIMHGMELGTAGMHNQVAQWARQPYFSALLDLLLDSGFRVYLTADHGNIEALGCGRPTEGAVADLRGERVRVYPDAVLRGKVSERFPNALEWAPIGLPHDYLVLLAPARQAFIQENCRSVCHGGISIEELIVPLVQIERRGE